MLQFFNMLQLIGGLILAVGYLPQIIKIIKTKSVRDFSLIYLGGIFTGIVFMEAYAVYMFFVQGTAGAFFATNTVSFILSGTEFLLVLIFWNRGKNKIKN
ncbi:MULTISPECIES: PQ-loop repeat-containing protein [Bacillus subtilis group]|uniref:PQ-loop repeat-containing protein n=1 Tax=Bacillus subtilis group TaxID=653685 RepID=UPI0005F06A9C|nr:MULTISPECIES: PQ-loop repeat-containing protein [Bacillus subtilis group]MCY8256420.1 PQ-loop repeat-containing protein [Bacillus spizizenii]MDE1381180.1 PQ-loop repeat-containing protein [Bacillus licheniformis]